MRGRDFNIYNIIHNHFFESHIAYGKQEEACKHKPHTYLLINWIVPLPCSQLTCYIVDD